MVKSFNGLKDNVQITGAGNVVLKTVGNTITIDVPNGGDITNVIAGNGLLGGAPIGDAPLSVDFGGNGASNLVARSDHNHTGQTGSYAAMGKPSPNVYIATEIQGNRFSIAGGAPGAKISWQVTGIRYDTYANENRILVEEDKPAKERGVMLSGKGAGARPVIRTIKIEQS